MCSHNEEHWDNGEEFDTKELALAYAMDTFALEYGLEDGANIWIGQIYEVSLDSLADAACDAYSVIDQMTCWLHDNVGEFAVDSLDVSKAQEDDLDARLTKTVREWLAAHDIKPNCFTIERVERHTYEQCKETRPVAEDDVGIFNERCQRHIEHEGACEWP